MLEDDAENPSMTMEIGKLRVLKLLVEFRRACFLQECSVGPQPANGRSLRVPRLNAVLFLGARMALLCQPHALAFHFIVPPGVAEVSGDHIRARMNVADDALARRNRTRELMANGMAGLVPRNRGIGSRGLPLIAVSGVRSGMLR